MSKQVISLGTAPTGAGGDDRRSAWTKARANFTELYNWLANASQNDDQVTALPTVLPLAKGGTGQNSLPALINSLLGGGLFGRSNAVGPVSQSSSTPTGAIIETGTNANGTYTKFADGSMICRGIADLGNVAVTTLANPGLYTSANQVGRPFAAQFSGQPQCVLDIASANATCYSTKVGLPTTSATQSFYVQSPASQTVNVAVSYIAYGRWF